jgi:hypothetical protein
MGKDVEQKHPPVIVHVFVKFPTDMRHRCGTPKFDKFTGWSTTEELASNIHWGGALLGLAICVACARRNGS